MIPPSNAIGPFRLRELVEKFYPTLRFHQTRNLRRKVGKIPGIVRVGYRYFVDPASLPS